MMKKPCYFLCVAALCAGFVACQKQERNTAELIDPWLRERTPVNIRLDKQVGAANISVDWRHDDKGSVVVQLVTGGLDLTAVRVVALDFQFPDSEYCPTSSLNVGDAIDLSSGEASFTVTAFNGETREYTLSYSEFVDPIVGTYVHTPVGGILDGSAPLSSSIVIGGWPDAVVLSTAMDKWWQWGTGYYPPDEEDNIVSFQLTEVDSETGATFGTIYNYAGEDGLYANWRFQNNADVNGYYRMIPVGASRWSKTSDGVLSIYDKDDDAYANPLYELQQFTAGVYKIEEKDFNVPDIAWGRSFYHADDEWVIDGNWPDSRWMRDNIRFTAWLMSKSGDTPAADHNEKFAE